VFTVWYALSPYIRQIRFVFKGLMALHYYRIIVDFSLALNILRPFQLKFVN
jgi:hypothetical protein